MALTDHEVRSSIKLPSLDIIHASLMKRLPSSGIRHQFLRRIGSQDIIHKGIAVRDEGDVVGGSVRNILDLIRVVVAGGQGQ